ncbi:MAG: S8 family serine peptidase [Alphaproteobacteria bacterium]
MIGIDRCRRAASLGWGVPLRLALSVAGALLLGLAACSGGGGGSGAGTGLRSNPDGNFLDPVVEPSAPFDDTDWSTSQEYLNSTGLAQLKAAEGYARRSGGLPGGQGVRIAIIDSGIDVTHPDLGNLSETSWAAGGEALVGDSHATFVAGIVGASRTQSADPNDMHGIAYRATLLNFQAARPSQTAENGFVSFATADLVEAIGTAAGLAGGKSAVEADIMNLSLGASSDSDQTFAALRTAMRAAAAEDKIMVLAAGNERLGSDPDDGLQPIYPAVYATDPDIAGLAIVVGNLTSANQAAASSNLCGDARNYCLFAPGTSIRSTINGGSYGIGSGTSFAAPYVAGAAAVVKAAFPGVSSSDVVNRLLLTAADLGDPGVDSTFGRGRLDLEAAMAPVGPTAIPAGTSVDGPVIRAESSRLSLGRGLVMNEAAAKRLARVMAVDSMGFPFPVDLGKSVSAIRRDSGLSSFIEADERALAAVGSDHARVSAFVDASDEPRIIEDAPSTSLRGRADASEVVPLKVSADLTERTSVFASLNGEGTVGLGLETGLAERRAAFMQSRDFLAAHQGLAGAASGAGFTFSPAEGTTIGFAAYTSMAERERGDSTLERLEVKQAVAGGIDVHLGLGLMQEEGGFMGGRTSGAFGDQLSSRSQFFSLALLGPLTETIDWFTSYSRGRSSIGEGGDALIKDWSDTSSEAFGAGLIMRDLARDDDGLTVMVGQPLRQEQASATLDLPTARRPDGSVVRSRDRLDFAPKAREIAAEIGYRLPLNARGDHDIQAAGFIRLNPDHDPNRAPETGIGLTYRLRF